MYKKFQFFQTSNDKNSIYAETNFWCFGHFGQGRWSTLWNCAYFTATLKYFFLRQLEAGGIGYPQVPPCMGDIQLQVAVCKKFYNFLSVNCSHMQKTVFKKLSAFWRYSSFKFVVKNLDFSKFQLQAAVSLKRFIQKIWNFAYLFLMISSTK